MLNDDMTHTFLGCTHRRYSKEIDGKKVEFSETDVTHAMEKALAKYEVAVHDVCGKYPRLFMFQKNPALHWPIVVSQAICRTDSKE